MKRSKGFILAEILTGLLLQALFILVLCGAFYLLVSFGSGTQQILTARERGQRVISYVDSRIRNAGLGLWNLTSSNSYRDAFNLFISEGKKPLALNNDSKKLRLPVALTFRDKDDLTDDEMKAAEPNKTYTSSEGHTIQYGNILTLLYAEREMDTSPNLIVIENQVDEEANPLGLTGTWDENTAKEFIEYKVDKVHSILDPFDPLGKWSRVNAFNVAYALNKNISLSLYIALEGYYNRLDRTLRQQYKAMMDDIATWIKDTHQDGISVAVTYKFITNNNEYSESDFNNGGGNDKDIQSYGVMINTGYPILVGFENGALNLATNGIINNADELLYLKGERMFIYIDGNSERNFSFQNLTDDWSDKRYPHQKDILEIYMELDRNTNIFTLYVLASGGTDGRTHERPSSWPKYARPSASNWNKSDYRYHVLYVSKASWKLHNVNFASYTAWD